MIVYCISFTTIFKVLLVIFLIAFDRNRYIATNTISLIVLTNQSEKKGKVLTKHRPHGGKQPRFYWSCSSMVMKVLTMRERIGLQ